MPDDQEKIDAQIRLEMEQKESYNTLTKRYKALSKSFLTAASFGAAFIFMIIIIFKFSNSDFLSAYQYFFIFISLFAFCISIALHWQYQTLSNDDLSDFSPNISLLAKNQRLGNRLAKNRTTVYNNNAFFYIGVFSFLLAILLWLIPSNNNRLCKKTVTQVSKNDVKITVDLLQINDVYEIAPLDNDMVGGMARIATLKKQFQHQNENTFLLMAGDFLSPSVFNSVRSPLNEKVAGKQMIAAMNVAGVDLAVFGNHEFDVSYNVLQQRINESSFQWVSSNVYHKSASGNIPFQKNKVDIPTSWKKTFFNDVGTSFTIGFFGVTIPDNKGGDPEYVSYDSTLYAARKMYKVLAPDCDAVIAITHQDVKEDSMLAVAIPQLTAIIGGHEHDMQFENVGHVIISKAHSNARSVFHLKLLLNRRNNTTITSIVQELIPVDTTIKQDYLTKIICSRWMDVAKEYFKKAGFSPDLEVCKNFTSTLDGKDASVRNGSTNLSKLITDAMLWAGESKGCDVSILNSGAIRVDDFITSPITQYAVLRALPYEGKICIVKMKGWFLKKLNDSAAHLKNEGAFLQYSFKNDKPIADSVTNKIAIGDYLISGKQSKLNYLKEGTPGIIGTVIFPLPADSNLFDVRKAVINYMKAYCGKKELNKYRE
ncbi:bifunctional metallophosphatase/5'-nucleotidase [Hanamia caeni]|uniref:Bifunctional metallophosphatase/5'-nucleotidase n=1 Tax=Hanamia caeni TaxID=2294116 RepID=A0A3M9NQ16_9BACT|nr:bifunctional metallophosphatase/5'-nucleotidase [Hanamia caeni]RNI39879.1 bifunctional metallophosphatase/5'-nucleotidase [Hanamia caeni]